MAEVKITALPAYADPASTDVLPIVDVVADLTKKVSIDSLLKNAPTGSASAPSFAFDLDGNTGMYRSGADALAFSTGGTGRLFIDSSGRVGIGNASPSSNGLVTITETTNARLYLSDSTLGNAYGAQLRGYGTSGLGAFAELGVVDNNVYKKAITITQQAQSVIFSAGTEERMRLDTSGRLLIGTSSSRSQQGIQPLAQVEHTDYSGLSLIVNNTNDNTCPVILMGKSKGSADGSSTVVSTNSRLGVISFQGADGTDIESAAASIECRVDGNPGANNMPGRLEFRTTANGATSPTERMRIDSSGRLLVGTSSSSANTRLIVAGNSGTPTAAADLRLQRGSANPGSGVGLGAIYFTDSNENIGASVLAQADSAWATNDYPTRLVFSTTADSASSPTERMRIDSSGNVLVGKTSNSLSGQSSSVQSNSVVATHGPLTSHTTSAGIFEFNSNKVAIRSYGATAGTGTIAFNVGGGGGSSDSEAMRIQSSGNVGIGTSSPSSVFHISRSLPIVTLQDSDNTGNAALQRIDGKDSGGTTQWFVGKNSTSNADLYVQNVSSGALRFATGNNERVQIDSSGKLKLHHAQQFEYNTSSTDSRTWYFNNDVHAYGDFAIRRSTTQTGSTFETKYLFHANGGICFNGDTAAANALDDYEEGNWTPSLIGQTTNPALTYSSRGGRYEKIGALIHCSFFMHVGAVTTQGSGQLRIGGLPFNANSNVAAGEVPAVLLQSEPFSDGDGANRWQFARTAGNANYMLVGYKDLTTGGTAIPAGGAANVGTGYFIGHVTYRVN